MVKSDCRSRRGLTVKTMGIPMSFSFTSLLDFVDTSMTARAIGHALGCFARHHGFRHYAYLSLQDGGLRYFGDYPKDWRQQYMAEELHRLDPVIATARRVTGPFVWSTGDWGDQRLDAFKTNAIGHGLSQGVTIAARASFDRQLLLSFSGPDARSRALLSQDISNAVPVLMGLHYKLSELAVAPLNTHLMPLSSRELLCLTWAAKGKTAVETGMITSLSTRTVQHYLDAARLKLGAATVSQLVAIAKDRSIL